MQSGKKRLLDMVNRHFQSTISETGVRITAPKSTGNLEQVHVQISGKRDGGAINSRLIRYERLSLSKYFNQIRCTVSVDDLEIVQTTHDLIPHLKARYGIPIDQEDIKFETITHDIDNDTVITLHANDGSYFWCGEVEVTITVGIPWLADFIDNVDIGDLILELEELPDMGGDLGDLELGDLELNP